MADPQRRETGALLAEAVRGTNQAAAGQSLYLWAASQFAAFKTIRQFARQSWELTNEQHLVVAY